MGLNETGGMWERKTKQGRQYFSIRMKSGQVYLVFRNRNKIKTTHPDYIVYESIEDEQTYKGDE